MSTRSVTYIYEMDSLAKNTLVCSFYRHHDGYPKGHGRDLANFLSGKNLVNGIGINFEPAKDFNRAGTMAVKLMNYIQDISGCEVFSGDQNFGASYIYRVYFDDVFWIECEEVYSNQKIKVRASEFDECEVDKFFDQED